MPSTGASPGMPSGSASPVPPSAGPTPEPPVTSSPVPAPPPVAAVEAGGLMSYRVLVLMLGVFLIVLVFSAVVFVPDPQGFQYVVFRTMLATGCACIAGATPWYTGGPAGFQAAGVVVSAAAVFALVYLYNPAERFRRHAADAAPAALPAALAASGQIAPDRSIFISYRRTDAITVGRLYERLKQRFGEGAVFKDIDSITAGLDFREELTKALQSCQVGVVIIGPEWELVRDDHGRRRLEDPTDFVLNELLTLLQRKIPVIPVITERPRMPHQEDLPENVSAVVFRQGLPLRPDPDFNRDADDIIAAIDKLLAREPPSSS